MNVILEGPDAVGKTTLAEKLRDKYHMSILHSTSKTRNDFHYHIDLLDYRENTVFDRFNVGEIVYPIVYKRPEKVTPEEQNQIFRRIIDNNDMFIIFVTSDIEILNERLRERGEDSFIPEMTRQNELFMKVANEFQEKYHYKNFYMIDVAKENAYDDLDKWIDEHFGQVTVNMAYRKLARDLLDYGQPIDTRNPRGATKELCNYSFVIDDVENEYITLKSGGTNLTYLAAELLWYWSARNDLAFINKFSTFWNKVTDDGVTANSAYGYILQKKHGFNQIEKIIELLTKDPLSRRAILNINVPNENVIETKDEMCTICLNYQIRHGKLHCTCVMRSNDSKFGLLNDIGFFVSLQKYIAKRLGVDTGTYTHSAFSIHMYNPDFNFFKDVAYGTMETNTTRLNIELLLEHKEELVNWVDTKFTSREDFTNLLKSMNIIYDV